MILNLKKDHLNILKTNFYLNFLNTKQKDKNKGGFKK